MYTLKHKLFGITIVFVLGLCIVLPAQAESVDVTNVFYTYSNSGGQGVNGESGQDGKSGADGQSGSNGQTVISGSGSASVKVQTTVNGKTVQNYEISDKDTNTTVVASSVSTINTSLTDIERSRLIELIEKIRAILMNYVYDNL